MPQNDTSALVKVSQTVKDGKLSIIVFLFFHCLIGHQKYFCLET